LAPAAATVRPGDCGRAAGSGQSAGSPRAVPSDHARSRRATASAAIVHATSIHFSPVGSGVV